jgi:cytochrome d ubiquinol oxidase subunit II
MLLALLGLIIRPVGFKYRSKIDSTRWRALWDLVLFTSGFVPALIFGVALGNVLQGVPFHFDHFLRVYYTGSFWGLLNPFALLCGLLSVVMLSMHGSIFLTIKTDELVQKRAINYTRITTILTVVLFAVAGLWIAKGISGYVLSTPLAHDGPSNPLYKQVLLEKGAWLQNYYHYPFFLLAPIAGFAGALLALLFTQLKWHHGAWVASSCSIVGIIATAGVSMFPFILPSSTNPSMSLMVWDASSSQLTLMIMLAATVIFLPLIIVYTSWVYYVLRGKVTRKDIEQNSQTVY